MNMKDLDRYFNDMFNGLSWSIGYNIFSNKDGTPPGSYEFEVPGFAKEDLKITVDKDNWLIVEGTKGERSIRQERLLSDEVDVNNIKATCQDGLLTVVLTSKAPSSKATEIQVKIE